MSMMRMPLTCWTWFVTAILGLLGFAVLLAAGVLLLLDRIAGTSFFLPAGLVVSDQILNHKGGSPLLWQHLFWFFGHPEVYIAILPGMGVTSQLLSTFSRKPIFGYRAMVYAILGIGFLGFLVWGHHMFMSGMNPYSAMAFSILTMSHRRAFGHQDFQLDRHALGRQNPLHHGHAVRAGIRFAVRHRRHQRHLPGPAGARSVLPRHLFRGRPLPHDHGRGGDFRHVRAARSTGSPKCSGRMMNETLGKIHFYLTFIGVYAIFTPDALSGHCRQSAALCGFHRTSSSWAT